MKQYTGETLVLEKVTAELQAEGYEVYQQPSGPLIPSFLGAITPDAIAIRSDKKLVVEVLRDGPSAKKSLDKLRALIAPQSEWELRVYWIAPSGDPTTLVRVPLKAIEESISNIALLMKEQQISAAFLMAWATFEAMGRALLPEKFIRPQTPGRVIEVLASEGHLTPNEADALRRLIDIRNKLIHGGLQTKPRKADLKTLVEILKRLTSQLEPA